MTSLPLHPAVVHLPLGLALVLPFLAAGFAWALWTGRISTRAWITIVALQAVLLGGGLVAMNTGEHEEDRVESLVPHDAIEQHEELADQFIWATGATLLVGLMVLASGRRQRAARLLASATVIGTLVVAALAVGLGHAGGELVYRHNAGAAYAPAGTSFSKRH